MKTIQILHSDGLQLIPVPAGFELSATEVAIRREGQSLIVEPVKSQSWPDKFFEQIRIDDPAFARSEQGAMPAAPRIQ